MTNAFQLKTSPDGIAELNFNLPNEKINKFSVPILEELEQHIDRLAQDKSIRALKFTSGKEGIFIAGADLHSFEPAFDNPSLAENIIRTGHRVFKKVQQLPFPTIAVINGACLGGGLEFALSCTYRVVTDNPKTKLGLPEVTLGIFPGWGGTQRLPRLIGLMEGMNMILSGRDVPGTKAYKMRLADAIVPADFADEKTHQFIQSILTKEGRQNIQQRQKNKGLSNFLLEDNPLGRSLIFYKANKDVLEKTKGRYPAPLIALNVIKETYPLPLNEGLKKEADTFIANIPQGFALAKNLIGLFFIQEAAKKESGVPSGTPAEKITYAAILGAGTMGATLAWLFADHNVFTRLKDISWDILGKGLAVAKSLFDKGLKAKKIKPYEYERRLQLISPTIDYSGFNHAQLILEAATENLELKRKIFQEVEAVVKPTAIIASNTSSLTIEEMTQGMKHPERFIGMHFFNPVNKMPLVEIVPGKQTNAQTIATAFDFCKKLGKTPILVQDCAGFLVNRIFLAGANEVAYMLEEGYPREKISQALLDFGMPMDPFQLSDEVGNDVSYKAAKSLEKAYGERMRPAKLMQTMVEKELYGRKNGKGFNLYQGDKITPNPEIKHLLPKTHTQLKEEDILPRFLYAMINEASRCLDEKIVSKPEFLDLSLITGIGFPPFRGGLLRYADEIGSPSIVSTLERFEKEYGMRFQPAAYLKQKAQKNGKFYSNSN